MGTTVVWEYRVGLDSRSTQSVKTNTLSLNTETSQDQDSNLENAKPDTVWTEIMAMGSPWGVFGKRVSAWSKVLNS